MLSKEEKIIDRVKLLLFLCFLPSQAHCGPNYHAGLEFVDTDNIGCRDGGVKFTLALRGGQACINKNVKHKQD